MCWRLLQAVAKHRHILSFIYPFIVAANKQRTSYPFHSYRPSAVVLIYHSMSILRPATPGFLVTLIATILLVVVSFSVPYFKSVYFLRASLTVENINGSITFGTLGYCFHLSNGTTCSKPSIGYQLGQSHSPLPYTL